MGNEEKVVAQGNIFGFDFEVTNDRSGFHWSIGVGDEEITGGLCNSIESAMSMVTSSSIEELEG